jgi:hypothetical protein
LTNCQTTSVLSGQITPRRNHHEIFIDSWTLGDAPLDQAFIPVTSGGFEPFSHQISCQQYLNENETVCGL